MLDLETLLNADGNQSVQIEFRESTLTASYEADDDEAKRSGNEAQAGDENRPAEKPKSQVNGKIVIIDANGNRKEYQFNGDQARVLQFMQNPAVAKVNRPDNADEDGEKKPSDPLQSETEERYVLGVQCEEASELLRAHLKLGSNGLVILEVREETPAAEAGLQEGDIIISLNEKDLQNLSQLVEAVSKSDGAAVKLSLLRAGDRQDISVTPRKMQVPMMVVPAGMEAEEIHNLMGKGVPNLGVRRIHAGVLLDGHVPGEQKDVRELVEKLRQMAEDSEAVSNTESRITITTPGTGEVLELKSPSETENAVRQLQKQVRELQEQLSELRKKVQPTESGTTIESAPDANTP
ncbi:MAG: PDZ domain-containing protein [Planctomycetaceae bacterium]